MVGILRTVAEYISVSGAFLATRDIFDGGSSGAYQGPWEKQSGSGSMVGDNWVCTDGEPNVGLETTGPTTLLLSGCHNFSWKFISTFLATTGITIVGAQLDDVGAL